MPPNQTDIMRREMLNMMVRPGDVLRRKPFLRRSEWYLVVAKQRPEQATITRIGAPRGCVGRIKSDMELAADTNRWPDEVCAAVAKFKLSQ